MKRKIWLGIVAWIAIGIINAGFVQADLEHALDYMGNKSCGGYRKDLGFSVGWSMLPMTPLATPFMTGFYQHGWRLTPREDCKDKKKGEAK